MDERSFTGWASEFGTFANAFQAAGVPIDNLIGFLDAKLFPICRPGRYQRVMYSGHKRIHGVKIQSTVFPNGECCCACMYVTFCAHRCSVLCRTGLLVYPFGPCNGSRHDGFVLRESGLLDIMQETTQQLGQHFVLFADSAYPVNPHLWRMYKGANMTPVQRAFNSDMASERIAVEWAFGNVVALWPYLDFRKKWHVLHQPVGLFVNVGVVLTNVHTCMYGNIVLAKYGMERPELSVYIDGGPDAR